MVDGVDLTNPRGIVESLKAAVQSAEHLTESDEAAVSAAFVFARRIESAAESGNESRMDKLMYGPVASFGKMLNDLGLTPTGRAAMRLDENGQAAEEF